ncbi:MAG: hypothetical protein QNJ88_17775 [Acidimicrobiia bacterium]|nr:hypothetical protein [Acidimicrobiia bacterium]
MTNDQIRQELSSIAMQLTELPGDDFSTRSELRDRRLVLREEIARRPIAPADLDSMRRELVGLHRRMAEILDERPIVAGMADGGGGEAGMAEAQELGWDYDAATGRNAIAERIAFLQRRIAETRG